MHSRRVLATLALPAVVLGSVAVASGCKAAAALSTQEVVVHFAPGSPESAHVQVAQTCGLVPHVSAEPLPPHENAGQEMTDVHFLVKPGSDKNLQALTNCLAQKQFQGVVLGIDPLDM